MKFVTPQHLFAFLMFYLCVCMSHFASAANPTFPFTVEQFRAAFNEQALKDEVDVIRSAQPGAGEVVFRFDDAKFQRGVKLMKDMDLMNGKVIYNAKLIVNFEQKTRRVTGIIISGTRADPINMLRTVSAIGAIYVILNPGATDKQTTDFTSDLGLLRGDDSPTIGIPMSNFSKGGAFTCNNQDSSVSVVFGCFVVPRS
jgi:hypothetical protein